MIFFIVEILNFNQKCWWHFWNTPPSTISSNFTLLNQIIHKGVGCKNRWKSLEFDPSFIFWFFICVKCKFILYIFLIWHLGKTKREHTSEQIRKGRTIWTRNEKSSSENIKTDPNIQSKIQTNFSEIWNTFLIIKIYIQFTQLYTFWLWPIDVKIPCQRLSLQPDQKKEVIKGSDHQLI